MKFIVPEINEKDILVIVSIINAYAPGSVKDFFCL